MKAGIVGCRTKLGMHLATLLRERGWDVCALNRPVFDLLDPQVSQKLAQMSTMLELDLLLLNAFSHDDHLAQGRCFGELVDKLSKDVTLAAIGSTAPIMPWRTPPAQGWNPYLRYRLGKQYLRDVMFSNANRRGTPRLLLIEPGVIMFEGALYDNVAGYLVPEDIANTLEAAVKLPGKFVVVTLRNEHWTPTESQPT